MKLDIAAKMPARGDRVEFFTSQSKPLPGITAAEFSGAALSTLLHRSGDGRRTLYVGLGDTKKKPATAAILRKAVGTGVKALLKIGAQEIVLDPGSHAAYVEAMVEGALLAAYKFEVFKAPAARRKNNLQRLTVLGGETIRRRAEQGAILARAANMVREIGNLPANIISPAALADRARALGKSHKLTVKVWDEKQLKREGFGGILAVGQGSANPPRFISIEYKGKGAPATAPYVVVGKAITFDTGGISIKPAEGMDEMKFDKMGGCAVLGILQAVSELKLPIRVVGLIASAENMPGSRAYRPGDIISTYNGQTIEVLNTDAEGRIVLADALSYAVKNLKPKLMFDMATLTGAAVVALGHKRAALFATDDKIRQTLWDRSEEVGDLVWPLPFGDEYDEQIKSDVALVKNTGGRYGGACTAASFLHQWTGDTPWVHLDIAATGWTTTELPYLEKGATGAGLRLITDYLRQQVRA